MFGIWSAFKASEWAWSHLFYFGFSFFICLSLNAIQTPSEISMVGHSIPCILASAVTREFVFVSVFNTLRIIDIFELTYIINISFSLFEFWNKKLTFLKFEGERMEFGKER